MQGAVNSFPILTQAREKSLNKTYTETFQKIYSNRSREKEWNLNLEQSGTDVGRSNEKNKRRKCLKINKYYLEHEYVIHIKYKVDDVFNEMLKKISNREKVSQTNKRSRDFILPVFSFSFRLTKSFCYIVLLQFKNNLENLKIRQLYILKFDSALSRTALSFDSASVQGIRMEYRN